MGRKNPVKYKREICNTVKRPKMGEESARKEEKMAVGQEFFKKDERRHVVESESTIKPKHDKYNKRKTHIAISY